MADRISNPELKKVSPARLVVVVVVVFLSFFLFFSVSLLSTLSFWYNYLSSIRKGSAVQ